MSVLMSPVGPEPPGVYWVRRAAVIVVALTLIVSLWWLLVGRGSSSPETTATSSTSDGSATEEIVVVEEAVAPVSTEPVDCLDWAIAVSATTDSSTYRIGLEPVLSLVIENIGDVACLRDVGAKANELEIKSGGYHVWSSDDCSASQRSKIATLEPGDKVASSISWDGKLSQKGCPKQNKAAKAGRYEVIGRNLGVVSDPTPFALSNKN
ncbi:MAG: hypothetical protein NWR45_02125 [Candidatus Nanopelagicales bacterium]|jgi:hypothetical protein|nr:hypothetical protein [Candidatus Nanopelagicales bacterium]